MCGESDIVFSGFRYFGIFKNTKTMRTKDLILNYIKRGFKGVYLPSADYVVDHIVTNMGCEVEIVENSQNSLKLKLVVEDDNLIMDFTKTLGQTTLQNWCTDIKFVE
jgi:hypothetical protein